MRGSRHWEEQIKRKRAAIQIFGILGDRDPLVFRTQEYTAHAVFGVLISVTIQVYGLEIREGARSHRA